MTWLVLRRNHVGSTAKFWCHLPPADKDNGTLVLNSVDCNHRLEPPPTKKKKHPNIQKVHQEHASEDTLTDGDLPTTTSQGSRPMRLCRIFTKRDFPPFMSNIGDLNHLSKHLAGMLGHLMVHLARHMKNSGFMQTVSSSWTGWICGLLWCVPVDQSADQGSRHPGLTLWSNLLTLFHLILISTYFNCGGPYSGRVLEWVLSAVSANFCVQVLRAFE
jgi:hypothetical protein